MPIPLGCYNLMDFNGVKILNELKENGEEFINEVASINKTSHISIVTLLGFCYNGSIGASFMSLCLMDHFRSLSMKKMS